MTKVLIAAAVTLFLSIVCAAIHIKFSALPVDPQDYDTGLEPEEVRSVKWIPVTERLPEETGSYLVWMLWPHDETHVHAIINYDADCEAFGEWEDYYDPVSLGWVGSDFIKIENVYAWMPLPEPPEGGADG